MIYPDLRSLIVCRSFLDDPVVQALLAVLESPQDSNRESDLAGLLIERAEQLGLHGNILSQYLLYLFGEGDNTAAKTIETCGTCGHSLQQAMAHDMKLIWPYLHMKVSDIIHIGFLDNYHSAYSSSYEYMAALQKQMGNAPDAAVGTQALLQHYGKYGRGALARYIAFRVAGSGQLEGIDDFPFFAWEDLIAYEAQKEKLLVNTKNFINGKKANNALLTGARGTGKSTAIKALANRYHLQGLRLIQITQGQLEQLPIVMEQLCRIKSKKFILFLDDISFDEGQTEYKYLKSAIDGGVIPQPDNTLIYATSNRRHLLRETWKDRSDEMDEVYRGDSINESISLSDRFGLIIHYSEPTQDEYLRMIAHELRKAGITLLPKELRLQGVRWEMEHSGRNGRIAGQFVKWYLGNQ